MRRMKKIVILFLVMFFVPIAPRVMAEGWTLWNEVKTIKANNPNSTQWNESIEWQFINAFQSHGECQAMIPDAAKAGADVWEGLRTRSSWIKEIRRYESYGFIVSGQHADGTFIAIYNHLQCFPSSFDPRPKK